MAGAENGRKPDLDYIDAASTVDLLTGPEREKTLIIDVRGKDYEGGHIKGAINVSSDKFQDDYDVEATIKEHLAGKQTVIVHCALSQVRGPFCASRLSSRLAALEQAGAPDIKVLQQGFNGFVKQYGDRDDLVEGLDKSINRD